MQKIEAIIKPFKLEEVKQGVGKDWQLRYDGFRGKRFWAAERTYGVI